MRLLIFKIGVLLLLLTNQVLAKNPIYSPTFDDIIKVLIADSEYIFDDENIKIKVPDFADNPRQVPIFFDATKIKGATKIILFADLNPIYKVFDLELFDIKASLSLNIKVAQETPIRVLVLDEKNLWHIGSANIKSSGGGCTSSPTDEISDEYKILFGKHKSKIFKQDLSNKIRFTIFHPMETGLSFGKVEFFINSIDIKANNSLLAKFNTTAAISENPKILFETSNLSKEYEIYLKDSDANEYKIEVKN